MISVKNRKVKIKCSNPEEFLDEYQMLVYTVFNKFISIDSSKEEEIKKDMINLTNDAFYLKGENNVK